MPLLFLSLRLQFKFFDSVNENKLTCYMKITALLIFITIVACNTQPEKITSSTNNIAEIQDQAVSNDNDEIKFDCDFFGQKTPGNEPVIFAPGIVSTNEDIYGFEISPSGKEMIFTRPTGIYIIQNNSGQWTKPEIISFSRVENNGECCFARDGDKIFFNSRRPCPGSNSTSNIWISEKKDGNWTAPYYSKLSKPGKTVHAISMAANGNIYSDGVTKFTEDNGSYSAAQKLNPNIVGYHVFIASDESYLIFDKRVSKASSDLFICFSKSDGTWTPPAPLLNINTAAKENQPFVSGDEKYFFFTRSNKVHWLKADFIEDLRIKSMANTTH